MSKQSPTIKILIAAHKDYPMPSDPAYLPIFVGAAGKQTVNPAFARDDSGHNISVKNSAFCELTALYWAWQNPTKIDADYVGLVHYRRLFQGRRHKSPLTTPEIQSLLQKSNLILPRKRHYYIENLYDHYIHTMHAEPLDLTGKIIQQNYPEYYPEFTKLHTRRSAHMFNMLIMSRAELNSYCEWLFDILFALEKEVKKQSLQYDAFHARFYGRISELLLDVYFNTRKLPYTEAPVYSPEPTNWLKKGTHFLRAKFAGKKYEQSF